jgi:ZF-HD class homeobox domain-containing protein|uniref:ZF-HD dimerization-type domain-containing protein n=1 Tax=Picea sitchensis TaxID=3332 RepID=B8LM96_PICSI|nr:unknown [Picea sitchensis]
MMDHHHSHHQIPVSISPVSFHDISRLQQNQIYHNPTSIVHETGTGNNIHGNNNNAHVGQNGNGDEVKPLVEKSKKAESVEKIVRYRECQKNHAANIGSHALDGCGEFMASGLEGTADALKCQACGCHRNFHRQEVEGEGGSGTSSLQDGWYLGAAGRSRVDKKRPLPGGGGVGVPLFSSPSPPPTAVHASGPQMLMALSSACTLGDPDLHEGLGGRGVGSSSSAMKKRFRTKFSQEQKEKMHAFADQLGWRIQKHDEAAVHQFCNEAGVRRHVLKVWMHNNKNTLGKKS